MQLEKLFPLHDIDELGEFKSWEERSFRNNMLVNAMVQLSHIERNIRISENICIKWIMSKQRKKQVAVIEIKNS